MKKVNLPEKRIDLTGLAACLSLALAFRLPGLAVFLTADESRSWLGRSIIFLNSLARGDWANTAPGGSVPFIQNVSLSPAPGVTTMWAGALGLILAYVQQGATVSLPQFLAKVPFDPLDPAMLFYLRLPGVLVAGLVVGLTYWWSRPWLGGWGAFLAAGLLALDPFYLALSRVLGHDAPVAAFMWLSLLAFLRAMAAGSNEPSARSPLASVLPHPFLLLSGALAGLAFLSKYPALFMGPFIAGAMLFIYLGQAHAEQAALKQWLIHLAGWSVAAGVAFMLFWPAMWVNPLGPITTILNDALRASGSAHQKGSFFLGQPVPDPGLLFYPLVAWLRSSPLVLGGLALSLWPLLQSLLRRRKKNIPLSLLSPPPSLLFISCLWTYILLYTLLVTYGGKKQDRYLLPAFPAMITLAAVGYVYVSRITYHASRITLYVPRPKWLVLVTLLLLQIGLVYPSYPYYFSYYNPLAGGARAAARLIQVGWGEGLDQAAAYLNTLPHAESSRATSWYSTTFEPYFKGRAIYKIEEEKISRSAKPGIAADYVVFYLNQIQRRLPSEGVLAYFQQQEPLHTVVLNGQEYAWIYAAPGVSNILAGEARLVGQAELLGYTLSDEAGRPVTAAYPESVVFLSLYWEWQGKAETEPIQLSLVDADGNTRGWGNRIETAAPIPYAQWQDGMIARDDFALVIFADTPPGEYRLAAWIERPATGETVGVFPLENEAMVRVAPRPPE
ncbi:MAG: glycosyltransferase family 39 protein [Anaerolineae bacterium]|nr:glycosyltransferase family 39 protein [Anaerolineae bacterium]